MAWYSQWSTWRRVLAFVAAALALLPQYFVLADDRARLVAFAIALVNLAIASLPDAPLATVQRVTGLRTQ